MCELAILCILLNVLQIDASFQIAEEFFKLPLQTKLQYQRNSTSKNSGYVCVEQERLSNLYFNTCKVINHGVI